jgi:hypothetical protein
MSIARWAYGALGYPVWAPYAFSDERRIRTVPFTGGRFEQRVRLDTRRYRQSEVTIRAVSDAQRDAIDQFFVGLGYEADSFLVEDPRRNRCYALNLGTSIALQTAFPLSAAGEFGGAYPIVDPTTLLYSDGVSINRTVDTDGRILNANSAPGAGHAITADLYFWCRVVLRGRFKWIPAGEGAVWETTMTWEEVPA